MAWINDWVSNYEKKNRLEKLDVFMFLFDIQIFNLLNIAARS